MIEQVEVREGGSPALNWRAHSRVGPRTSWEYSPVMAKVVGRCGGGSGGNGGGNGGNAGSGGGGGGDGI